MAGILGTAATWAALSVLFSGAGEGIEILHDIVTGKSDAEEAIRKAQKLQAKNEAIAKAYVASGEERREESQERMAQYKAGPMMALGLAGPGTAGFGPMGGRGTAQILTEATVAPTNMLGFLFPSAEELDGIQARQALATAEPEVTPSDLDFSDLEG